MKIPKRWIPRLAGPWEVTYNSGSCLHSWLMTWDIKSQDRFLLHNQRFFADPRISVSKSTLPSDILLLEELLPILNRFVSDVAMTPVITHVSYIEWVPVMPRRCLQIPDQQEVTRPFRNSIGPTPIVLCSTVLPGCTTFASTITVLIIWGSLVTKCTTPPRWSRVV